MAVFKNFVGQAYTADSLAADAQSTMNLYLEAVESGEGQNTNYLRLKPGLTLALTCATSPIRGIWIGEGRMFVVAGSKLIEVFSDNSQNVRGDVGNDGLPAQIFPNGNQIMVISALLAYVDNGAGPAAAVYSYGFAAVVNTAAAVFPAGNVVTWVSGNTFVGLVPGQRIVITSVVYFILTVTSAASLVLYPIGDTGVQANATATSTAAVAASAGAVADGYYIAVTPSSKQVNSSALLNGLSWNPIDVAYKEGYPDNIQTILWDHLDLWVFGSQTTEVWKDDAGVAFPFARDPGAYFPIGCAAINSPVKLAGGIAFLAGDTRGWVTAQRAAGYQLGRVSTHAIETAWSNYATVSDAVSAVYLLEGHEHWVITFPGANATWDYDATAASWTQRGWWNGSSNDRERWMYHGFVFGQHYVGDWQTGNIYTMSSAVYQDNGVPIHWSRTAPWLNTEGLWSFFSELKLLMQAKIGDAVALNWAELNNDGSLSWHTAVSLTCAAAMRFIWRRLGKSQGGRVFQASGAATGKVAIVSAFLTVEQGDE